MDHGSRVTGTAIKITKATLPTPCAWWAELPRRASHPTACLSSRRHPSRLLRHVDAERRWAGAPG